MAVVLQASDHPAGDRVDLIHEVIAGSGVRRRLQLKGPPESVDLTVEAWTVGPTQVLRTVGTSMTLTRTARDVRADAPELIAIALAGSGCAYSACGAEQVLGTNGLTLIDFATPYAFSHAGPRMHAFTTHISHADLGLGVDVVRAAVPRLAASPLLTLLQGHLLRMSAMMDEVTASPAVATDLGAAVVDLTRAVVASAAGGRRERDVLHETLRARVVAHIRAHLDERDLTPARIAAAHHISLRTLYNVWGDRGETLAEWIVRERLERVHRDLARMPAHSTIFAVARRWGFVDQGHFTRRFRAAYGVAPREWVRRCRSATAGE
ncbi:helix-turn-helix domain-containing protein [Pseudonocardia humida]|uniref:Helix-turn-helix domain-containing protein n=1 Tax=Pseudonocardia humida TaxID=2800819 RepID=A0ABT1A3M1_9PSEU|nr:helix-turn-helix domain-containing protein [Pseudonocardia humida]MCO1657609.1 helix-turn-helix domain-containing protein [Pseudonocardia humida]